MYSDPSTVFPLIRTILNPYTEIVFFGIGLNGDAFEGWIGQRLVVQLVVVDRVVVSVRPLPLDVDRTGVEAGGVQEVGRTRLVDVRVG